MKKLLLALLLFQISAVVGMAKQEDIDSNEEDMQWWVYCEEWQEPAPIGQHDPFPVFENFSIRNAVQFYFDQHVSEDEACYIPLERALQVLDDKEPDRQYHWYIANTDMLVNKDDSIDCKVKKYEHTGVLAHKAATVCFQLDTTLPTNDLLMQLKSIASDTGPYQMVRIMVSNYKKTAQNMRLFTREAQTLGFSFYSSTYLEWRRLSTKLFQAKIKRRSLGADKNTIS